GLVETHAGADLRERAVHLQRVKMGVEMEGTAEQLHRHDAAGPGTGDPRELLAHPSDLLGEDPIHRVEDLAPRGGQASATRPSSSTGPSSRGSTCYNTWLHGFCSHAPGRLMGVGVISLHDPNGMVAELERVAAFGWKAVVLRPNPVKGRLL